MVSASDTALFDRDALDVEIQQIRERLALLASSWASGHGENDPHRALERANAWLGNVTNPITPEERQKWQDGSLQEQALAEHDDNDLGNWVSLIENSSTDEDIRNDLQYFEEE